MKHLKTYNHFCLLCFEKLNENCTLTQFLFPTDSLCYRCRSQMIVYNRTKKINQLSVHILYVYNDFIENMLYQWKEQKDVALKRCFLQMFKKQIEKKYKHYTIVYMPSSDEKTKKRGFHTLEELTCDINLNKVELFEKTKDMKQSLQSYEKRKEIGKYIRLKEHVKIPETKLLLIDDVCTTGSTLLCAYSLLKKHKYEIKALVLCANPRFINVN